MPEKKPVGGRRSYQPGRPPKPAGERHRRITFSVPPDVADALLAMEHRSEWLTATVRSAVRSAVRSQSDERTDDRREPPPIDGV